MSYGFGKLNDYMDECHKIAKSKGFWEDRSTDDVLSSLAVAISTITESPSVRSSAGGFTFRGISYFARILLITL